MDLFDDLPEPVNNPNAEKRIRVEENESVPETKRRRSENETVCLRLKGFVAERRGEREGMEDAHVLFDDFNSQLETSADNQLATSFYGVFDGHGGARASNYAATNLHRHFATAFRKAETGNYVEKEITKMFVEAFKKTDDDFLKEATKQKPTWKDGSTALTIVAVNDVIYIANLGDSKAVLCRYNEDQKKCVPIVLSKDHNPVQYEERMRIQKMGGYVREGRVMGILEVSRSIGDGQYKTLGVTCIPDIKRCQLIENDRFIIMGCDGLWKTFSAEASIQFVQEILDEDDKSSWDLKCETAAGKLSSEAVRRGSGDNVTVVLIYIKHNY